MGSRSAYLREHAHNPVDWYPWGKEALERAVDLDRPIFLSIGYVSCHWCHVMAAQVFEQDDVAAFLNERFICIKVDREERPDLDAAYMDAVSAMTGGGGWPLTAFLTPTLHPFFGGTFFPHDRFLGLAREVAARFRTERAAAEQRGAEVSRAIAARMTVRFPPQDVDPADVRAAALRAAAAVDPTWGGFGGRTKFPTPVRWMMLLHAYRKWGAPEIRAAVRRTLDAMASGGIHDQVGGGFFRYATEPTWTIPHFEKMLYDNAQLAELYLEAASVLGEARYREVALDTLDFMLRDMKTPQGTFGASFDADSGGREGATYLWTPADLRAVAGDQGGRTLAVLMGITDAGNFEGASVPTLRSDAVSGSEGPGPWKRWRPALLEARSKREQPAFDAKAVTAWNGLAIRALALGYRVSGDARFLSAALSAAETLESPGRSTSGGLARVSNGGVPGEAAILDDYAFLARAEVDLFEATSSPDHLERALSLATEVMARFATPGGAWFLTADPEPQPMGRRIDHEDGVEPSGNAVMIETLERLAALTGRADLSEAAGQALRAYGSLAREQGIEMAGWLDGALLSAGPSYELVIAGDPADPRTLALVDAWEKLMPPWVAGARVPADGPGADLERVMPPARGKRSRNGAPAAYVCTKGSCKEPVSTREALRAQLLSGWLH